jgi:hypothetical protein
MLFLKAQENIQLLPEQLDLKSAKKSKRNLYKMTMPGRFFVQNFLRQAVDAGCEYAILEMTSEAAKQFRHKFIDFDALIFLNLSPEHIESHGGYDKYIAAKVSLAEALEESKKPNKVLAVNGDDKESRRFSNAAPSAKLQMFSLKDAEPYILDKYGLYLHIQRQNLRSHLQGTFNIYNILAALTYASTQGILHPEEMQVGLDKLSEIPGRVQKFNCRKIIRLHRNRISKLLSTTLTLLIHWKKSTAYLKTKRKFASLEILAAGATPGSGRKWAKLRTIIAITLFSQTKIRTTKIQNKLLIK